MDWLGNLFTSHSIASAVIILALTIAIGMMLNRIKFGSVSLGVTWVLFVGIVLSHFGLTLDPQICHFIKEFGLILFVYSIGIQVGPSFISSLRDGGIKLNMLAMMVIFFGCVIYTDSFIGKILNFKTVILYPNVFGDTKILAIMLPGNVHCFGELAGTVITAHSTDQHSLGKSSGSADDVKHRVYTIA